MVNQTPNSQKVEIVLTASNVLTTNKTDSKIC